jgi:hypothetical protein
MSGGAHSPLLRTKCESMARWSSETAAFARSSERWRIGAQVAAPLAAPWRGALDSSHVRPAVSERDVSDKQRVARRRHVACLMGALVLGVSYGSCVAAAVGDTWEGTWERTELPGKHLLLTQTGSAVSGSYDWNDASGRVLEGKVSGATLTAGFRETHYEGSFTLTLAGKKFTGSYTGKNRETGGSIEGPFDGKCVAGACRSNGAPPSPAATPVTPASTPPTLGKRTLYEAPAPGADASYPVPTIAKKTRGLEGTIGFVDNEGKPVQGPSAAAVQAQAERAGILCYLFLAGGANTLQEEDEMRLAFGAALPSFGTCTDAVSRVLARNDELQRTRAEGARARAAGRACSALVGGKRRAHSPLSVRCKASTTGLSFDIRPRSSRQTLAKALHGHAPRLIIGRSKATPGPVALRLSELWRAK